MPLPIRPIWDIFCKIVDNFGDIGICWRLSRQLATEHEVTVRLWVDDLSPFHRINNEIDPSLDVQFTNGVEVRRWVTPFPAIAPADVVVETFACEVPEAYQLVMAERAEQPVWINLEYLSAESWVNDCHRLPSPHPRLPLTKYYFFPGFVAGTGGVLCERGLVASRNAFRGDPAQMNAFWQSLGLPPSRPDETRISLFSYENPAIEGLLRAWANGGEPVLCLVPEGRPVGEVRAFFDAGESPAKTAYCQGNLEVRILPFLEHPDYDRLLWACDCNFVRGEDSFVRAQWAGMPFVWHIYPQKENTHWIKLNAFLDQYAAQLAPDAASDVRAFWRAWNSGRGACEAWRGFWRHRAELQSHTMLWVEHLIKPGDLAANLVRFVRKNQFESLQKNK